jgi:small conductance mechanosensitive channel
VKATLVLAFLAQDPAAPADDAGRRDFGPWLAEWLQHRAGDIAEGLAFALLTLVIGLWGAKLLVGAARKLLVRAKVDATLAQFLANLAYYVLATLIGLAALERVGVQTASFIAILGAAGLAVGFALQGSLGNLASGVMIMLFRPFRVGDLISAGGQEGVVEEIQVFATVLKTPDNKRVILPNSAVTSGSIVNHTGNPTRRVDLSFTVAGVEDARRVKSVLAGALATIPQLLKSPPPDVEVLEIGAAMKLVVRPWCKTEDYWVVYFAVQEAVKAAFQREQVAGAVPRSEVVTIK